MNPAPLVIPAIRWSADGGFRAGEEVAVRALDAGVGGFIIFGGPAGEVGALTARLQERAATPLLFAADLERGAGQQFAGLSEFPPPAALAGLDDPTAIRAAASVTAREALAIGINWVLAPVADLDHEPANPIVQTRAFGADPVTTAAAVRHWVEACQEAGALACAKHYPGHGRTTGDSHSMLPVVSVPAPVLEATDMVPFRAAITAGVASLMTSHVAYPALDATGTPATFSLPILGDLRNRLGFDGLVVSDALVMAGALEGRSEAVAAEQALGAGVDLFLYPANPLAVIDHLTARLAEDPGLAARAEAALVRRERALARVGMTSSVPGDAAAATEIRARLLHQGMIRGARPGLRAPIEVVVVDDDLDGSFPPSPSDGVATRLLAKGMLGHGGSRVVLAFAEPRAGKGRAGFGPRAQGELGRVAPGADLVVLFGHPRLVEQVPGRAPVLLAWHRQAGMQASVGEWIANRLSSEA